MKRISIAVVVLLTIILAVVTIGQQEDRRRFEKYPYPCGSYGSAWQSYEILEAKLLSEIENKVRQGLDKAGWQPLGGVVYDMETKRYLQVMVHPRKIPEYP